MITLYHETTKKPVEIDRFLGDHILVKRYAMPEQVGSLFTPQADHRFAGFGIDKTQTLWEVLHGNAKADEWWGAHIPVGAIVSTQRRWPLDIHLTTEDGIACFLLSASRCGIRGVILYDHEG